MKIIYLLLTNKILTNNQTKIQTLNLETSFCNQINILELSIKRFHHLLKFKLLKVSDLVNCYLNRIKLMDPYFNSIIQINDQAILQAKSLDQEIINLEEKPLFGIPIILKDNIATKDMNTTAGSLQLINQLPNLDSSIVKKLKKAGAIILAKSNLSLWSEIVGGLHNGWSEVKGQTLNPYIMNANPLGSSTGSSVSISLNFALVALGTDTHGSIGGPAGRAAVVGFKPTSGLISRKGIIPYSLTHDSVGPITRNMEDATQVLNVLAGPEDDYAYLTSNYQNINYLKINNTNLNGMKIGIDYNSLSDLSDQVSEMTTELVKILELYGATIIKLYEPIGPKIESINIIHNDLDYSEFKYGIEEYLNSTTGPIKELKDLIKGSKIKKEKEKFKKVLNSTDYLSPNYIKKFKKNLDYYAINGINKVFSLNQLDVLVSKFGRPSSFVGYPILTYPLKLDEDGLPLKGPAFTTLPLNEVQLIKIGRILDLAYKRPLPLFKPCCTNQTFD